MLGYRKNGKNIDAVVVRTADPKTNKASFTLKTSMRECSQLSMAKDIAGPLSIRRCERSHFSFINEVYFPFIYS